MQKEEPENRFDSADLNDCVQCGECASVCPRHRFDQRFNPRKWMSRLRNVDGQHLLHDRSLWACMKCYRCADICRRSLSPAEELMKMRRLVMARKAYQDEATRHAQTFVNDIRTTGKLNEAFLPLRTLRLKLYKLLPLTLRMIQKGKMPPMRVENVEQMASLKAVFRHFE